MIKSTEQYFPQAYFLSPGFSRLFQHERCKNVISGYRTHSRKADFHKLHRAELMHAEWLPVLMQGSFNEIYVVDCDTLRFVQTNLAARRNLQYSASELACMIPFDLAPTLPRNVLEQALAPLRCGHAQRSTLETLHRRKDATTYPIEFRLFHCTSDTGPVFIAIGNDTSARKESARALQLFGQCEGIIADITQSRLEQAELSAHAEMVKEKERARIAREIHDDLGSNLTAIKMAMALVKKRLPPGDAALAEKADYVETLVDRTIESIHRISADLRPSALDFGLMAAIEWQAREFEKQFGIAYEFSSNKKEIDLHPDQASALFRIFQEALTNIGKHANATCVSVRLTHSNRSVCLEISDNGRGIATADRLKPKSFGIRGMVERAKALGGRLSVSSGAGGGTTITLKIPLAG